MAQSNGTGNGMDVDQATAATPIASRPIAAIEGMYACLACSALLGSGESQLDSCPNEPNRINGRGWRRPQGRRALCGTRC
jgi:hypothetical protein